MLSSKFIVGNMFMKKYKYSNKFLYLKYYKKNLLSLREKFLYDSSYSMIRAVKKSDNSQNK